MNWFKRPVTALMAQHNLPSPSMLMAQMLALRIGQLPPEHTFRDGVMYLVLPIQSDHGCLEVRVSAEPGAQYWTNNRQYATVTVGMAATPAYKSVDLSREEALVIIDAAHDLHLRTRAVRDAARDAESQHNALDILEYLL